MTATTTRETIRQILRDHADEITTDHPSMRLGAARGFDNLDFSPLAGAIHAAGLEPDEAGPIAYEMLQEVARMGGHRTLDAWRQIVREQMSSGELR